jgi:hypothetical protein
VEYPAKTVGSGNRAWRPGDDATDGIHLNLGSRPGTIDAAPEQTF